MSADPRVVDAQSELPDFDSLDTRVVEKMVLGQLDTQQQWENVTAALHAGGGLRARFPKLTHLYLWSLDGLDRLPDLPDSLQCLDVRKCGDLAHVPALPATLERLIVEECPRLRELACPPGGLPHLVELSLRGTSTLTEASVHALLAGAPLLEVVDLSTVRALQTVACWPAGIVDLRLNDCSELTELPEWPACLRRLEVRGTSLEHGRIQGLPDTIDYLDLGGMRSLRALPDNWRGARTLFLHGSGVLAPPASEHGAAADENVAARTRAYFDECDLVGHGRVKRCKVLLLGNGGAGKTCLALWLVGGNPARTRPDHEPAGERIGSTHGVQFHDWRASGTVEGRRHNADVHVWDFGGQDIYRNTHRVFLATGTVFVIVWNPDPEPVDPTAPSGYVDRPRPLGYWLDYVEQAGNPAGSEVVIVCSHRAAADEQAMQRMRDEVGAERLTRLRVRFVDALDGKGDLEGLRRELEQAVARVVDAQGTMVPAHWEIAQEMVERWIRAGEADSGVEQQHRQMTKARFGAALAQAIQARVGAIDRSPSHSKLQAAIRAQRFLADGTLEDGQLTRVLDFLTHSGWVYWREDLLEGRVIVGQQWALRGLYTLLQRESPPAEAGLPGARSVYERLRANRGRFTLADLVSWGWDRSVPDPEERELLVSFMERIGLCFRLIAGSDAPYGVTTYVSLEHLPSRSEIEWPPAGVRSTRHGESIQRVVEHPRLHQGHWDAMLRQLGSKFGRDAAYARDGYCADNAAGSVIEIRVDIDERGFGGKMVVEVWGAEAPATCDGLADAIEDQIASALARRTAASDLGGAAGEPEQKLKVFISYAWDPERRDEKEGSQAVAGYEAPVDAICAALQERGEAFHLLRDRYVLNEGDDIVGYNLEIKNSDRVVVVHSDRYWRSQWCMHELTMLWDSFDDRAAVAKDTVTFVFHAPSGGTPQNPIRDGTALDEVEAYWNAPWSLHPALRDVTGKDKLLNALRNLLSSKVPKVARKKDWDVAWNPKSPDSVIAHVLRRVLG
ncbi:MAG: TIR domain-containing protein [Planctomycetota bacterium]